MHASTLAKVGGRYFFCVSFWASIFGCVRVPFLEPLLGRRVAELLEMPLLLFVITRAAKAVPRSLLAITSDVSVLDFAWVGILAISIQLSAEWLNIKLMAGKTLTQFVKERDEIGLYAFLFELAVFTALPIYEGWEVLRKQGDIASDTTSDTTLELQKERYSVYENDWSD